MPGADFDRPAAWDHLGDLGGDGPALAVGGMTRRPTATARGGWRSYHTGPGAATVDNWKEIRYEQPARAASVQADVQVPALQAAVTGLFVGAAATIGALWLTLHNAWPWYIPPAVGGLAWLVVAGVMWSNLLTDSRALLRKVESYIGRDDDEPGPPENMSIRVETLEPESGRTTYDLLGHRDEVRRVFLALDAGRIARISRPEIIGLGISDYTARAILVDLKEGAFIDYPNGPTAGAELTARGRALARKMARGLYE